MVSDRIGQYIDYKGVSYYAFENALGASRGSISKAVKEKKSIGSNVLENILSVYEDLNPIWLLTGQGAMIRDQGRGLYMDEQNKELTAHHVDQEGIPLIPVEAMAGFCAGNSTPVMDFECDKYVIPNFRGAEFLIQVKGDSMCPKYTSGDVIACKKLPLDTFFQWNKVYVIDSEQGVLVKRVKRASDPEYVILVSENKEYDPFELPRKEITSLAIVIGVIRLE